MPRRDREAVWRAVQSELELEYQRLQEEKELPRVSTEEMKDGRPPKVQRGDGHVDIFAALANKSEEDDDTELANAELTTASALAKNEINTYRAMDPLPHSSEEYGDPLAWWKLHQTAFPLMARVARRVLNIPATSGSSERVFSSAGNVISKKRTKLSPDIASTIVFLRGSWGKVEQFWDKWDGLKNNV